MSIEKSKKIIPGDISIATATAISKMNKSQKNNNRGLKDIDVSALETIKSQMNNKNNINDDFLRLFPDINFCADTASLSVISPNDMSSKTYNLHYYDLKLGSDVKGTISTIIKDELDSYYELENSMVQTVKNSLYMKGADVEIYIPEAALNDVINGTNKTGEIVVGNNVTVESAIRSAKSNGYMGIFNDNLLDVKFLKGIKLPKPATTDDKKTTGSSLTLESALKISPKVSKIDINKYFDIEFVDNSAIMYSNIVNTNAVKNSINSLYKPSVTTESANISKNDDKLEMVQQLNKIFSNSDNLTTESILPIDTFNETTRKSQGRPLYIKVDMDIVKPIWSVTPDNHIGYLVLLDENSNLLSTKAPRTEDTGKESESTIQYDTTKRMDNIIQNASTGLKTMMGDIGDINNMEDIYSDILHNMIVNKINSGKLEGLGNLSKDQNFLKLMFNRALEGKQTKVLFLPEQLVSYFAYEHRSNGMGISKLEKISPILNMRAMLMMANLVANIKNSMPITEVEADIDNDDMDAATTYKKIQNSISLMNNSWLLFGGSSLGELADWGKNLGTVLKVKSENLPATDVKFNDISRSIKTVETDLTEKLEELSYMEFDMTPDMVSGGLNTNFATSIVTQNRLFENRIYFKQLKTNKNYTKRVRKIIENDATIRDKIKSTVKANLSEIVKINLELKELRIKYKGIADRDDVLSDFILDLIINKIYFQLPRPANHDEGDNLDKSYELFRSQVDSHIEDLFDTEAFSSGVAGDEMSNRIDEFKAIMKKMIKHEWVSEHNYMPAINKFLTMDEDGKSSHDLFENYNNMMTVFNSSVIEFIKKNKKIKDKLDLDIEKINSDEPEPDDGLENTDDTDDTEANDPNTSNVGDVDIDEPLDGDTGKTEGDEDIKI